MSRPSRYRGTNVYHLGIFREWSRDAPDLESFARFPLSMAVRVNSETRQRELLPVRDHETGEEIPLVEAIKRAPNWHAFLVDRARMSVDWVAYLKAEATRKRNRGEPEPTVRYDDGERNASGRRIVPRPEGPAEIIDARARFAQRRTSLVMPSLDPRPPEEQAAVRAAYAAGCPVCGKKYKSAIRLSCHLYKCPNAIELFNARCRGTEREAQEG